MFERIDYENLDKKIDEIETAKQLMKFLHELMEENQKLVLELNTILQNLNSDNVTRLNLKKTKIGNPEAAGLATQADIEKLILKYHSPQNSTG